MMVRESLREAIEPQRGAGDMTAVGRRIREIRERKAYSIRDMAEGTGLAPTTIWAIENGHNVPRPKSLRRIAGFLGIEVEELTTLPRDEQQ